MSEAKKTIVLVTGLSGAGRSSFLKALEDTGFEVFDNLPLTLLQALLSQDDLQHTPIAFGVDIRTRGFKPEDVAETFQTLKKDKSLDAHLVFLTCDEAVLQKCFSETRRRHPLASDRPVSAGIKREMDLLMPLRPAADIVLDTTELSIHDLKRFVQSTFREAAPGKLAVSLLSFGFKYGIPREADMVLDIRFVKNPHWESTLRALPGTEKVVQDFVRSDPDYAPFMKHLEDLIAPLLPRYRGEGKSYLTIAIGCTGGRHRSVTAVTDLAAALAEHASVYVQHRDLERSA